MGKCGLGKNVAWVILVTNKMMGECVGKTLNGNECFTYTFFMSKCMP